MLRAGVSDIRERWWNGPEGYAFFAEARTEKTGDLPRAVHRDGERIVVDVLRAWRPPVNPSGIVGECADLLKCYRLLRVTGDRYAGRCP